MDFVTGQFYFWVKRRQSNVKLGRLYLRPLDQLRVHVRGSDAMRKKVLSAAQRPFPSIYALDVPPAHVDRAPADPRVGSSWTLDFPRRTADTQSSVV